MENTAVKTEARPTFVISVRELIDRLWQVRGTTFIQLSATTEPKMNKRGNILFGNVVKDSITNCIVGFNYENMVNNARTRELSAKVKQACFDAGVPIEVLKQFETEVKGIVDKSTKEFSASERKWGKHSVSKITGETSKILVEHTTKDNEHRNYVQVAVLNSKTPVYRYKDTGEVLTDEHREYIKQYMPKKKEGEKQELKKPIIVRDYRVDSVRRVTLNKSKYSLI